jgi:predicted ArsR family transcriptional regulator
MAEWKKEGKEYFLIENHCPICAAATECQGFCRAELSNFQSLLGNEYTVERGRSYYFRRTALCV